MLLQLTEMPAHVDVDGAGVGVDSSLLVTFIADGSPAALSELKLGDTIVYVLALPWAGWSNHLQ